MITITKVTVQAYDEFNGDATATVVAPDGTEREIHPLLFAPELYAGGEGLLIEAGNGDQEHGEAIAPLGCSIDQWLRELAEQADQVGCEIPELTGMAKGA